MKKYLKNHDDMILHVYGFAQEVFAKYKQSIIISI